MKKMILVLSLMIGSISMANANLNVNPLALATLLAANPTVKNYNDREVTLLQAISPYMLTILDEDNRGTMGVLTNECQLANKVYECSLMINNADIVLTEEGDYVKSESSTESAVIINYKINLQLNKLIDEVQLFYAG